MRKRRKRDLEPTVVLHVRSEGIASDGNRYVKIEEHEECTYLPPRTSTTFKRAGGEQRRKNGRRAGAKKEERRAAQRGRGVGAGGGGGGDGFRSGSS